jgi:hypothetical protein
LATKEMRWMERADGVAITGIDGLYRTESGFFAVQNGMEPPRVARLVPTPDGRGIARAEVLERGTPGLGEPTHGVFAGGAFYFIASSGWGRFDDDGTPKKDPPPDAPAIWVLGAVK